MKIWNLQEDIEMYEDLTLANGSTENWLKFSDMFHGESLKGNWEPLKLKLIPHGGELKKGDIPYLSPGVPVFSIRAINILKNYLNNTAEILDIEYDIGDYKIINVTNVINCLNHGRSKILTYRDSNEIKAIKKYAFYKEKVVNQNIFKIVEQPYGGVFVSDEFKNRVFKNSLEGFEFVEVWDSEE